jgi:hypothetical protein
VIAAVWTVLLLLAQVSSAPPATVAPAHPAPPDVPVVPPGDAGSVAAPAVESAGADGGVGNGGDVALAEVPAAVVVPPGIDVTGTVFARGGGDPVLGATLVLDSFPAGETDEAGHFRLSLQPGKHRLQIQAPGFDLLDVSLGPELARTPLVLRLSPRSSGERYQTVVSAPGGGIAIGGDDLTSTPGSLGEPFRIIESLPGVSQVGWPLALYTVRGANPGNTGFFVDGVRLPALFHLGLGPEVIHPYFLERIDFYPGGYPARFGRFVSGIVSATTVAPKIDRVRGSVDLRIYDVGGMLSTPFDAGKGTVMLAGRYSYTGLIFSALSPSYTLSYWDYQARVDHTLGRGQFTAFAFGSHDQLGDKRYPETNAQIDFHRLDLRWSAALGPGRLLVGSSLGLDKSAVSLDPVVKLPISIDTKSAAPRASYTILSRNVDVEVGADSEIQSLRPTSEREDTHSQALFQDRIAAAAAAYTALTLRPISQIEVIAAMRYDVFFEKDARRYEPGPRLELRFRPVPQTLLKAQVGRYAQTASLPIAVPGFESFGLASIGTQTSKQASAGIEQDLGDALSLNLTGFYQRLRLTDLLSLFQYDPQDARLLEPREGESYGVEVLLRRPPSHRFYGWLSYTWSRSYRLIGASESKAFSDWDQRHVLNLVSGVRLPKRFTVSGRFHLNTGRPYPLFDDDNPGPPEYIRLPTFYEVDFRIQKRFLFDRFSMDVYLEAVNATLTKQVFDAKRQYGKQVDRYYQIVLPSVGLHAEW